MWESVGAISGLICIRFNLYTENYTFFFKWDNAKHVTQLDLFTQLFQTILYINMLEKEMATHSSILAWRIPWTEEPGGLQSTGSQRVGLDWATSLSLTFTTLRKTRLSKWKDNPQTVRTRLHIWQETCLQNIWRTLTNQHQENKN